MSLPTLPTSEHDIVVPLPGQASIDSRLKHLRVPPHRRAQQKTPSGLVIDPVELLQCIGGSDAIFSVQSTTTYSHPRQAVTVVSSSSANQEPLFSFPSSSEGEDHTSVSSHAQHPHEESTQESSRVVEHFEVDPHARSVLAFRRNSLRQFSSLVEESEDQETSSFPPPTGKIQCRDNWAAPSEFGTYRLCEQRRFRRACASAQSRQNLRCSLIQAVNQEEPSDRKPDP